MKRGSPGTIATPAVLLLAAHATINSVNSNYFLRAASALSTTAGSSKTSADVAVNNSAPCPARPFSPIGTWSMPLP